MAALSGALVLAACGQAAAPGGGGKALQKVQIVQVIDNISFAPFDLAVQRGYFQQEGLDPVVSVTDGGGPALQAIAGNSAPFMAGGSTNLIELADRGIQMQSIAVIVSKLTMNFALRKDLAARLGLSRKSPLQDRLRAMKGLKIGITSSGAATEVFTRYDMKLAGLGPNDAQLVPIGSGAALLTALKQKAIDGFMLSPPTPEQAQIDGYGEVLVAASAGDVPGLDNFPYQLVAVRADYARSHPDVVRAVARAVARGDNFVRDHTAEALQQMQDLYGKVDPQVLKASLEDMLPAIPKDGLSDAKGWQNALDIMKETGMIKSGSSLDVSEGGAWTNQYVSGVNGKSG